MSHNCLTKAASALTALVLAAGGCDSPLSSRVEDERERHPLEGVYDLETVPQEYSVPRPCPEELPKGYCPSQEPVAGWELAGTVTVSEVVAVGDQLRLRGDVVIAKLRSPATSPSKPPPLKLQASEPVLAVGQGNIIADFTDLTNWNVPYLQLDGGADEGVISGTMTWVTGWFPYGTTLRGTFILRPR